MRRTYRLHVPPRLSKGKPLPLVLAFHGGGGRGWGMERLTRFSELADREGFIVAYPDGLGRNWNDGREASVSRTHRRGVDDVAFVSALIGAISREHPVDPARVYATGISNGAIFSHYLAARLSGQIAAIAPVAGGVAESFAPDFRPAHPVSVLIIQGTADPLVPYDGGPIAGGRRGRIVPTGEAARLWVAANGCRAAPRTGGLPDRPPDDGCAVRWTTWGGGAGGSEVTLHLLEGGGHTWPGGGQYLPRWLVGTVCRDFDATEAIWTFFKAHPKC